MTPGDLSSPPEGQLIRSARDRAIPKLSIPVAAARIGISPEHWGNIERGYKSAGAGREPARVDASPELLAKMAGVVGVMPDQLTEAGREDAARVLVEIMRRDIRPAPPPTTRRVRDFALVEDEEGLRPYISDVRRDLYAVVGAKFPPGQEVQEMPQLEELLATLPGGRVLATGYEAELWDTPEQTQVEKVRMIAILRRMLAEGVPSQDRRAV
jgi:hypothetical protein